MKLAVLETGIVHAHALAPAEGDDLTHGGALGEVTSGALARAALGSRRSELWGGNQRLGRQAEALGGGGGHLALQHPWLGLGLGLEFGLGLELGDRHILGGRDTIRSLGLGLGLGLEFGVGLY